MLFCYPDSWEKYECEELNFAGAGEGETLMEAYDALTEYELYKSVKEFADPVDKEKWSATPTTVNCSYYPQSNSIYILGAFAQSGFITLP